MRVTLLCLVAWLMFTAAPSHAKLALLEGFPPSFEVSGLWENVTVESRSSRAYRFVARESFPEVRVMLRQWLSQSNSPAQEAVKNGWTYLSHRKSGHWTTVQFRVFEADRRGGGKDAVDIELVEGIVSVWQDAHEKSRNPFERFESMASLQNINVIRRIESVDRGQRTLNLVVVGDMSVSSLVGRFASDLKELGLMPATYAPPLLNASKQVPPQAPYAAQAWTGAGAQVVFTVFAHRGRTAAQLFLSGGKQHGQ
jgi:hypothetical protein